MSIGDTMRETFQFLSVLNDFGLKPSDKADTPPVTGLLFVIVNSPADCVHDAHLDRWQNAHFLYKSAINCTNME